MKFSSILFCAALLVLSQPVQSQNLRFSVGANYGTFSMADLKGLQEEFLKDLKATVPAKITDKFPPFIGFEGSLTWTNWKNYYGIEAGYNSTAGRIAYSDYSGKVTFDQLVRSPRVGLSAAFGLHEINSPWEFFLLLNGGTVFNRYKLDYKLETAQTHDFDNVEFRSINLYFSGGVGVTRNIKKLFINAKLLYQKDIPADLKLAGDNDATLVNDKGDGVGVDWSGVRVAMSGGITF